MERYTKRIICICLCALIVALNIKVARAEAVPDVLCGSATVADCVMSYYALSGCAVANTNFINTLYNDLGSNFGTIYDFAQNGMLTLNQDGTWQATTALETAIENAPAYQSLGLDQVFNVTNAEVAAGGGLAAASGGSILGGALGCTASVGVLPLLGGVTAAYWGGIAVGTIAAHLLGLYGKPIQYGMTKEQYDQLSTLDIVNGSPLLTDGGGLKFLSVLEDARVIYVYYWSSQYERSGYILHQGESGTKIYQQATFMNNRWGRPSNSNYNLVNGRDASGSTVGSSYIVSPVLELASSNEVEAYKDSFLNGQSDLNIYSPDLIGQNGNLKSQENENGNIVVPDMLPQVDPSVQSGQPLSLNDWLNFANSAHQNSSTGALPDNSALFDNILNLVKKAIPNPNPNPNPNPDPYTPPNPTPSPDPDYDPNPDNPNQPDYESEREGQTEPVPDSIPTGAPWVTDGLLDKFPFCIPKDMIDMVKNFSSGTRQAPYISWRFNPPNTPVDYTFNLDLSDFEEIATLLRLLELGVFIVGLAFATRYLIGAT